MSSSKKTASLKVVAISVGAVAPLLETTARTVVSAIHKSPVSLIESPKKIELTDLGFIGDHQADRRVHGGIEKAVYAYPKEHHAFWLEVLKASHPDRVTIPFGFFGENLTLEGCLEQEVFVGDRWRVGDILLEVVKNREPCFKFNLHLQHPLAAKAMLDSGRCGWYLRVCQGGFLAAGTPIEVLPGPRRVTIRQLNDALLGQQGALF